MLFFIIFIIGLIIAIPISISKAKKKSRKGASVKFDNYIKENNITLTKSIDIPVVGGCSRFIVDEPTSQIYFLSTNDKMEGITAKKISFKDVIKCELIKDGKTKITEDKFSIFDNYNKKEYVKKLGIRITFNDLSFPYLDILFLNSLQGQTLFGLGNIVNTTNQWISIVNIIIERGKEMKNTFIQAPV